MKIKLTLGVILLIFVFITGLFFYLKGEELSDYAMEEIISIIEEKYHLELEIGTFNLWPVNQLILKNVQVKNNDNSFNIYAPTVKIYYNIFDFLSNSKSRLDSIYYIKFDQPEIKLSGTGTTGDSRIISISNISPLKVRIDNGILSIMEKDKDIEINGIYSVIDFIDNSSFRLTLSAGALVNKLNLGNYNMKNLEIDNSKLDFSYLKGKWEALLETGEFMLNDDISRLLNELPISIKEIEGTGRVALNARGQGLSLSDYNGSLYLKGVRGEIKSKLNNSYQKFNDLTGELIINSKDREINLKEFKFYYASNPYSLEASVSLKKTEPIIFANLVSKELELSHIGLDITGPELDGKARIEFIINGMLKNPEIFVDFYLPEGNIAGEKIANLRSYIRYQKGMVYLDYINLNVNDNNFLSARGVYDTGANLYSFDLEGNNIEVSLLRKYISNFISNSISLKDIGGRLDAELAITGSGIDINNLNIIGNLEVSKPVIGKHSLQNFQTDIWLAEKKLLLTKGSFEFGAGNIGFSGEIDLDRNKIDLAIDGKNIGLDKIEYLTEGKVEGLSGYANFTGRVSEELNNPVVKISIEMEDGIFKGYTFTDLNADLYFTNRNLEVTNLSLMVQGALLEGRGNIELFEIYPYIDAKVEIKDYSFRQLAKIVGTDVPLEGKFNGSFDVKGLLNMPHIRGKVESTELLYNGYGFDTLNLSFKWEGGRVLNISNLHLRKGSATLTSNGIIQGEELDLEFILQDFSLATLDLKEDLMGKIYLDGKVSGRLNSPQIEGTIKGNNLGYQDKLLDNLSGNYYYENNRLTLSAIDWNIGESMYRIKGYIENLFKDNRLNIMVTTNNGNLNRLITTIPFPDDYRFRGGLRLEGELDSPVGIIDLAFYNIKNNDDLVWVKGKLGEKFDLELEGKGVNIRNIPYFSNYEINIDGNVDFNGTFTGKREDYTLVLNTVLSSGKINQFTINKISGSVEVTEDLNIRFSQHVELPDDSNLKIKGNYPFRGAEEVNLAVDVHGFPLPLLSSAFSHLPEMEGYIDGNINISGDVDNPSLDGKLFMLGGGIDLGLPDRISLLKGDLIFYGDRIELKGIEGKYGEGDIIITGYVLPFNSRNTWNIKLTGTDLPFNYGSYNGLFNPQVTMTGSFFEPLVSGDLYTHDFIISIPFRWPDPERDGDRFKPDLDLNLFPGEDVYLRNDNIEVLIQEGTLNLSYIDEELNLDGELTSAQGSFDYYNNKFILNSGSAIFRKYNGYIPEVRVEAMTRVRGTRVIIQLNGPANNMITTFRSEPPLSREDILTLLTSRGGLGEIASGDLDKVVNKEINRVFHGFFQLDLVKSIEKGIKESFELDHLEIDTYDLGWNQEITVYLGKYLNDRIYLQYTNTFNSEELEREIAFQYLLSDKTLLEGSWRGEDDYSLSIETNIDF